MKTKVAGVTYNDRQDIIEAMTGDESVVLVPEPENEYDANAIKVLAGGHHIGYIPKETSAWLAPLLKGGVMPARVAEFTGGLPRFPSRGVVIEFALEDEEDEGLG